MIARVASFEGVNVQVAERTMDEAESIIRPMVEKLAGYQGQGLGRPARLGRPLGARRVAPVRNCSGVARLTSIPKG